MRVLNRKAFQTLCALFTLLLVACSRPATAEPTVAPTVPPTKPLPTPTPFAPPDVDLSALPVITADNADELRQLDVLRGHEQPVAEVVFNPDGRTLISSAFDGTLRLWDIASGVEIAAAHHGPQATGLAISPDGTTLASAGTD